MQPFELRLDRRAAALVIIVQPLEGDPLTRVQLGQVVDKIVDDLYVVAGEVAHKASPTLLLLLETRP